MGTSWGQVRDIFKICFGPVSDIFGTFLRHVFDIIKQIWDKFSTCLGQFGEYYINGSECIMN